MELLKEKGQMPKLPQTVNYVVAAYNEEMLGNAMDVARRIRDGGQSVDLMQEVTKKVAKAFNYADRVGAERIAFVAPGEWEQKKVRIKDLRKKDAATETG